MSSEVKRYYVAASGITDAIKRGSNSNWTHATLEKAIEHGKAVMERDGTDCVAIVQIIRLIYKKPKET